MPTTKELLEKRGKLAKEIRTFADRQDAWTDDDKANWETLNRDYDATVEQYDRAKRADQIDAELAQPAGDPDIGRGDRDGRRAQNGDRRKRAGHATEEQRALALQAWCRRQMGKSLSAKHVEAARVSGVNVNSRNLDVRLARSEDLRGIRAHARHEARALSVGVDSAGGYTAPGGFIPNLERALLAYARIRDVATVIRTDNGNELPWPSVNDTSQKGELLGENQAVGEQDVTFGAAILRAYKFGSKLVRVSAELLSDSAFDLATTLGSLLGERIGRSQADYFTTGTGAAQPRGIVTAATLGITTAGAAAITADETLQLVHSIDPAYREQGCCWCFHDQVLLSLRLLKDGIGRYLWQQGLGGAPDTFWNFPYTINQSMPSTIAASAKTVLFGLCSKYVIRDVGTIRLRRLVERYADQDQEGFVAFLRSDATLIDAGTHPVKYLQQHA